MKLWKIMLAAIVAVLMISCVAMAETADHVHEWSTPVARQSGNEPNFTGENGGHYNTFVDIKYCGVCNATDVSAVYLKKVEDCTFGDVKTVEATCKEAGYTYQVCKFCAYEKKVSDIPKLEHVLFRYTKTEATCVSHTVNEWYCRLCNELVKTTVEDDWGDHLYEEKTISAGDCKTDKMVGEKCKYCGDVKNVTSAGKGAHKWVETKTAATCTTMGYIYKDCSLCGAHEHVTTPALGHHLDWSTEVEVKPTCTTGGYFTATCHTCKQVIKYDESAPAHTNKQDKGYVNATCSTPGHQAYSICTGCNTIWDHTGEVISAIPVIPANGKHILPQTGNTVYRPDCTATNNYIEGTCEVCGKTYVREYLPAAQHVFPTAAELVKDKIFGGANCIESGWVNAQCKNCQKTQTQGTFIPALGHTWTNWYYRDAATCTDDMIAERYCTRCNTAQNKYGTAGYEWKVVEAALGHNWIIEDGEDATCTETGKATRICARCKAQQNNVTIPAKGHDYSKTIEVVKPTCDAQGYTVFGCVRCDATQKGAYTAALGHNYQWEVVVKPSEAGNGKNEYTCQVCNKVADTKTVKYTKYYYNNTMTSFGPTTKELVGGNDWYRVTPVDLTVDGVYTYDLIASNKYVVGTVTIAVNAGTMSVSYSVKGNVDVKDEALLIYASKADLAAGSAVTAPVGAAINVAETFGADTKVLVSLILTGDYDAAGKALVDEAAASAMIANID